jgi:type VI secretion system secreted protein Hcp
VLQDLSIVHGIDRASPPLMAACATGRHLPEATIAQRKAGPGQQDYLIIKLSDVVVTGVLAASATDGGSETVSLSFAKVDFEYKPQKPDGALDAGVHFKYDVETNQPG